MDASDVGERGEKKGASCPAITEVFFQSRVALAVRNRSSPVVTPSGVDGKPPKKSTVSSPAVFAPFHSGPDTSRQTIDCRTVPPKLPSETAELFGWAISGR